MRLPHVSGKSDTFHPLVVQKKNYCPNYGVINFHKHWHFFPTGISSNFSGPDANYPRQLSNQTRVFIVIWKKDPIVTYSFISSAVKLRSRISRQWSKKGKRKRAKEQSSKDTRCVRVEKEGEGAGDRETWHKTRRMTRWFSQDNACQNLSCRSLRSIIDGPARRQWTLYNFLLLPINNGLFCYFFCANTRSLYVYNVIT